MDALRQQAIETCDNLQAVYLGMMERHIASLPGFIIPGTMRAHPLSVPLRGDAPPDFDQMAAEAEQERNNDLRIATGILLFTAALIVSGFLR